MDEFVEYLKSAKAYEGSQSFEDSNLAKSASRSLCTCLSKESLRAGIWSFLDFLPLNEGKISLFKAKNTIINSPMDWFVNDEKRCSGLNKTNAIFNVQGKKRTAGIVE